MTSQTQLYLPDFLCIGAQKCGTSWLHKMLQFPPDLFVSEKKEIHFFDLNYVNGLEWYSNHFLYAADRVKGEITPSYAILSLDAIAYIKKLLPDIKLIYLLRNPIDRAWSQALMDLVRVPQKNFEDVTMDQFINFFKGEGCWKRGNYIECINNWEKHFELDKMFIGYLDEIRGNPKEFLERLFQYLGVDPRHFAQYAPVETKVHQGLQHSIPDELREFLQEQYKESIELLYQKLGHPIIKEWKDK